MDPRRVFAAENVLNLLLVFVPIAALLEWRHADPLWVFVTAALGIIPLAGLMGKATEHLAERLGEGLGGLLNATFGNAAELIIALMALSRGLHEVVKASITGSIIGNVLLVFGLAALAGGLRFPVQRFNPTAASVSATLLALSAVGLVVPAIFHGLVGREFETSERGLSFDISVVLLVTYGLSLLFTLRTHAHLYTAEAGADAGAALWTHAWSVGRSVGLLVGATALVAVMAEFLVGAVEATAWQLGMTELFVGVILVAVIGNAAEHSTAVLMALRDKMDLAIHIAVGSSMQIALFVAPLLVLVSYGLGPRPMDLVFTPFEVLSVALCVAVLNLIAQDGESNWLEGVMLLAVYLILAVAFWFLPAPTAR